jgi:2-(3-amino-3-carboxypropyl)histidine synthase
MDMRILLQFPEGLKQKALEYAKKYENDEVVLSASPCYGACDLALDEARWIKADKIVHFGHNRFIKKDLDIEVEYVPYHVDIEIEKLAAVLPHIENYGKIAIAMTVQHVHQFEKMKEFFESKGKKVLVEKGELAAEKGQVLGCDASTVLKVKDEIDAVVFIGSGSFHPIAIEIGKPVFSYNPYDSSVKELGAEIERMKRQRKGAIAKAFTCQKFGILVSTKPGQFNFDIGKWARDELRKKGKEAEILVANEFDPMTVNNFMSFECYINTACPRIADDQEKFGKPVLNTAMLKELLELMA